LIASIVTGFNIITSAIFLTIVTITLLHYTVSAAKISYIFHEASAMYLIIIYFTRAFAWTLGGATSLIQTALTGGEDKKN
jgi:hypothetical protein